MVEGVVERSTFFIDRGGGKENVSSSIMIRERRCLGGSFSKSKRERETIILNFRGLLTKRFKKKGGFVSLPWPEGGKRMTQKGEVRFSYEVRCRSRICFCLMGCLSFSLKGRGEGGF